VLLVHREDMYERESPRAGEADIIIASTATDLPRLFRSPSRATSAGSPTCQTDRPCVRLLEQMSG